MTTDPAELITEFVTAEREAQRLTRQMMDEGRPIDPIPEVLPERYIGALRRAQNARVALDQFVDGDTP